MASLGSANDSKANYLKLNINKSNPNQNFFLTMLKMILLAAVLNWHDKSEYDECKKAIAAAFDSTTLLRL